MIGRGMLLTLIIILSIFGPISTDMYLPGLPEMVEYFGTTETIMSMTLYLFMISIAIGVLFIGPMSDKYGRRKIVLISMALYTVSSLLCAICTNIWVLIALRIVQAIGGAGAMCMSMTLITDFFSGREMSKVITLTSALGVIGPVLAPVLGTVLIEFLDWRATFWVPAIVSFVCLLISLGIPASLPKERFTGTIRESLSEVTVLLRDRDFMAMSLMMLVFMTSQLAYISVSSYIYQDDFGMSEAGYSLALAGTLILGIVVMLILNKAVGNRGSRIVMPILLMLGIISIVAVEIFGSISWMAFLLAMVPVMATAMLSRSYGFNILMRYGKGSGGSSSSVLNFVSFVFCGLGTVVASLPWTDFMDGVLTAIMISCVLYIAMWAVVAHRGYRLENSEAS